MYTLKTKPTKMNRRRRRPPIAVVCLVCLALAGCSFGWETTIAGPDGDPFVVNAKTLRAMEGYIDEEEGQKGVPLERVLWDAGHPVIAQLTLVRPDGTRIRLDWAATAGGDGPAGTVEWLGNGQLAVDGQAHRVERIEVQPHPLYSQVQASITDLAPTAAAALGLPAPAQATGHALDARPANHVLLLFLDGFGYLRYAQALEQGDIPTLAGLDAPLLALTTYPPITCVSTGSLLTGVPPSVHGADRGGIRKTEAETIFDVTTAAGHSVVAVEGEALAFQLRGADWQLSGDRDGNGSTDDNVLRNALAVLAQGMPDLLLVHFHGIDDAGHTYGPGTPEERAAVREVDAAVAQILAALPEGTLVLVFADHGMHPVQEEGRLGNHGHLIAEDMLIPIFVWFK
jgi:hypothetical protein